MRIVALEDSDGGLERLLEDADGEAFVVTKAGEPVAEVRPLQAGSNPVNPAGKRFGFMTGEAIVPDDFDRMGEKEIEDMFYGST